MNILQNRIDSFQNNVVKWPYSNNSKYAKTESFAKAGFYFIRRPKALDSVRCFICDIELSNWKPNQSPFVRHGNESPRCAWKRLNFPDAHKRPLSDPSKAYDRPRSISMRSARLATFNCHNYWPPKKGTTKYPTAAKLAGAGFFFTPTAILPSRVKCAYCGESITVYPNDTDLLNKHQELSSGCTFFEKTHSTRNSRSTRSSSIKGDELDTDSSTSKRPINKVASSSETSAPIFKKQKEQCKALEPVVVIKKHPSSKDVTVSSKIKNVQKPASKTDDSIWDFNQILTPPKPSRRAMVTYGFSRPVHHRTLSARSNPSGVNILPDLKSSLIIKPNGPFIASPASKPIDNTKKSPQVSTKPKAIQTRRLQKPEASGSSTSELAAAKKETNPPKKRSLSISSQSDNDTPLTKKASLKKPIDTKITNTEITSSPTISLSRSRNKLPGPVTPSTSKERTYIPAAEGSGTSRQAPVYNQPAQIIRNVPPSNITHDNQGVSPFNIAHVTQEASPMDQDAQDVSRITQDTTEVSNLPIVKDTQDVSCYPMNQNTQDVSPSLINQDTRDESPSFMNQSTQDASPYVTQDILDVFDSPIIVQDTQDEFPSVLNPPSPVYTSDEPFVDKENVPPPIRCSPVREYSNVYNNQSDQENPDSPMHLPNYPPEPSSPAAYTPSSPHRPTSSAIAGMSFLQSTPSDTQRRLASAIDVFGSTPLSPIRPSQENSFNDLQYTPALTEGRVAQIITQDEEGTSRIVRVKQEPSQAGLLSDCLLRNQNMTVEEHWNSLVDTTIERIQERCESDITKIEENYNFIRNQLEKDL
ncbi:hypothetical protein INT48_006233 [Thamnidium elegans]|uniref:Uncharacterized protein n=1 Tax=Thamnidium elegans TaxID=101142 RepID=A0A8H7SJJ2_9FUNG|nr:hypothetical protein INT48_006233 [Thamnidium elegans]